MEQNETSNRLVIVGTTHVDAGSVERVRRIISDMRPSVVAVELCEERLWALRYGERGSVGLPVNSGLLPWLLTLLERAVGSVTDVFPGSEMLEAVEEAERVGSQIAMIDRPITLILEDLRNIPITEKMKIAVDAVTALFTIRRGRMAIFSENQDLDEVMTDFNVKYPTLSQILVRERDRYMADRLQQILRMTSGRVVAVVGLGHVKGIMQNLDHSQQALKDEHLRVRYEWSVEGFPG